MHIEPEIVVPESRIKTRIHRAETARLTQFPVRDVRAEGDWQPMA